LKRIFTVLTVALVMVAMVALSVSTAFASNPQGPNNPYATGTGAATPGENTTTTYKAPPADGGRVPGGKDHNAKGGNTYYTEGICRGPGC
jgi:hypothetical protein